MHDLIEFQSLAVQLAVKAGELLREGQFTARAAVAETKSSSVDPVTELDRASEQLIVDGIHDARPDDGLLGEEGSSIEGSTGVRWVIDPLDGTVNFTYGLPTFSVSIGVEIDGIPSVGAVYNPSTDQLFTAMAHQGAYLNGKPLHQRQPVTLEHALVATGFSYESDKRRTQMEVLARVLPAVRDIRRMGSAALDVCNTALGTVDAYFESGGHPWDFCGGEVIAREVGLEITSYRERTPGGYVLFAPAGLHRQLEELLNG